MAATGQRPGKDSLSEEPCGKLTPNVPIVTGHCSIISPSLRPATFSCPLGPHTVLCFLSPCPKPCSSLLPISHKAFRNPHFMVTKYPYTLHPHTESSLLPSSAEIWLFPQGPNSPGRFGKRGCSFFVPWLLFLLSSTLKQVLFL